MSFAALALTVCTAFSCQTYNIDTHDTMSDCADRLKVVAVDFDKAWKDTSSPKPLAVWLEQYEIYEEPISIIAADLECVYFPTVQQIEI